MSRARVSLKRGVVVSAAWVAAVCGGVHHSSADTISIVARKGQMSPVGVPYYSLYNFAGAEAPVISSQGAMAFRCQVSGTGITSLNDHAYVHISAGNTASLICQEGQVAPGATVSTAKVYGFSGLQVNAAGDVALQSTLSGTGITSTNSAALLHFDGASRSLDTAVQASLSEVVEPVIQEDALELSWRRGGQTSTSAVSFLAWSETGNTSTLLASGSTVNAFTDGARIGTGVSRVSGNGWSVFCAPLTGSAATAASALFIAGPTSSSASPMIRAGANLPGTTATISSLWAPGALPAVGTGGNAAFTVRTSIGSAICRRSSTGTLSVVAKYGDAIDGLAPGVTLYSVTPTGLAQNLWMAHDSAGTVAFAGQVTGAGINSSNDRALCRHSGGRASVMIQGGQTFDDPRAAGVWVANLSVGADKPVLNGAGDAVFRFEFAGTGVNEFNDCAIARYRGGAVKLLAREGQTIPGTDLILRSVRNASWLAHNAVGQVLFAGAVTADPLDSVGYSAIMCVDANDNLRVVARMGGLNTVGTQSFGFNGFLVSPTQSLSDRGEFVFAAGISGTVGGDTGVFRVQITNETPAPVEPPACRADFNQSGTVTPQDIWDFIEAYLTNATSADYFRDGSITIEDLFEFLRAYFAGCA